MNQPDSWEVKYIVIYILTPGPHGPPIFLTFMETLPTTDLVNKN